MITVHIEGIGTVQARLIQRYHDGTARVTYSGKMYVGEIVP